MVRAVEVVNPAGGDQSVLDGPQRVGRAPADHEGSAIEILLPDQVFLSQRVIRLRDQVNMARIEVMHVDARDLPCQFLQGEQDVGLFPKECLHAFIILEEGDDLDVRMRLRKQPHGFRQEVEALPDQEADRDTVFVFGAEILALLNGPLEVLAHAGEESDELDTGRRQGCALTASLKDGKADFLFQKADLIGEGRLADEQVLGGTAEVQRAGKLYAVVDLFGIHVHLPSVYGIHVTFYYLKIKSIITCFNWIMQWKCAKI